LADKTYTTIQGDMWDSIAYKVYGHERYMSTLLEANQQYNDLTVFPAGITITCPDVGITSASTLPPWRR